MLVNTINNIKESEFMKLKRIFAFLLAAVVLSSLTMSSSAHSLRAWADLYTAQAANSTYSFAINNSFHMEGNVVNYFICSNSLSKLSSSQRKAFRNTVTAGFEKWNGVIRGVETSSANAHVRIWYNSDSKLTQWATCSRIGGDANRHYRRGVQSHGRHDSEIFLTVGGMAQSSGKRATIMAHEIGHLYGIGDTYQVNRNLASIYSDFGHSRYSNPTRHDFNALRIGLNRPFFLTGSGNWRYQKSPGVWARNEWIEDRYFGSDRNEVSAYKVTYNANGGEGAPTSQAKLHGVNLTLTNSIPTAKSYIINYEAPASIIPVSFKVLDTSFRNWNTNAIGTGTIYNRGATYSRNAALGLFAQWDNPLLGTLPTPIPVQQELTFAGWFSDTGGVQVTSTDVVTASETIRARFTDQPIYRITYHANGGTNPPAEQIKVHDVNSILTRSNPIRRGHVFLGWDFDANAVMPTYFRVGSNYVYEENDNALFYAIWGRRGDVDFNGAVNIQDVLAILKHIARIEAITGVSLVVADVNNDGNVNILDVLDLLKHLAGVQRFN
jgi:hypothetical protein